MNDYFGDGPIKRSRVIRLSFVVNAGFSDHLEAAETNAIALSASMLLLSMLQVRVHHVRKPNAAVWLAVAINLDADAIRVDLAGRKVEAAIPYRSNRRTKIDHDRALYKQRNRIERMFGKLEINRAG